MKIAIIGSHGVGKTTLCYDVAALLKKQGKNVDIVKEVVRSCPLPVNKKTTKEAQMWILHTQIAKEIESQGSSDVVLCDRSVLDNYAYLVHKEGRDAALDDLVENWMKTYDFIFKIPISERPRGDNFRDTDQEWQMSIDSLIDELVREHGIDAVRLSDSKEQWAREIMDIISTRKLV